MTISGPLGSLDVLYKLVIAAQRLTHASALPPAG